MKRIKYEERKGENKINESNTRSNRRKRRWRKKWCEEGAARKIKKRRHNEEKEGLKVGKEEELKEWEKNESEG